MSVDAVDSAVLAVLAAVAPVLRHGGSRWYLFGAQAVTIWGRPRLSADVDITVAIAGPPDDFVAAALAAGFDLRASDWQDLVARTRVLPLRHRATEMPLDVVLAGPGLEEEFLERAGRGAGQLKRGCRCAADVSGPFRVRGRRPAAARAGARACRRRACR